jgi:hypothetical protein
MKLITRLMIVAVMAACAGQTFASPLPVAKTHHIEKQDRHISGFSAINVAGSFDVYIMQGSTESVKVEADDDVIDNIITEVKGGTLKIYTKSNNGFNWSWGDKKRVVRVTAKNLNAISLTGSGDVYFKEGIRAQTLTVNLNGSGDITGKIDVKKLESSLVGSGDITLAGHADVSTVTVSGSGDYSGRGLITNQTAVKVVGSGDASVYASQQIDASVAGSGDIRYTGGAKHISTSKAGSGDISRY